MTDPKTDKALDDPTDMPPDPREPMTDVQAVRLRELGEDHDDDLTKQEAAERIAQLEGRAG